MADFSSTLLWQDDERGRFGDGVSRPKPNQAARPYALTVTRRGERPLKVTLMAPSKRDAIRYARNRWPGAEVEAA